MLIFLSYSSLDKKVAGKIHTYLQNEFGVEVFLAHHDIKPATSWIDEIRKNLYECDVLIALLTENFYKSEWTQQEIGFALCRNIFIIPINAGEIPKGFLNIVQAIKLDPQDIYGTCLKIGELIVKQDHLKNDFLDSYIRKFSNSSSFNETSKKLSNLMNLKDFFSPKQKNDILRAVICNYQIYNYAKTKEIIDKFIEQNKEEIEYYLLREYSKLMEQIKIKWPSEK